MCPKKTPIKPLIEESKIISNKVDRKSILIETPINLNVVKADFLCSNDKFRVEYTINRPTINPKKPKAVRFKWKLLVNCFRSSLDLESIISRPISVSIFLSFGILSVSSNREILPYLFKRFSAILMSTKTKFFSKRSVLTNSKLRFNFDIMFIVSGEENANLLFIKNS